MRAEAISTLLAVAVISSASSFAEERLIVSSGIWNALTKQERDSLQKKYLPLLDNGANFGVIVDVQGVDRSTLGSNAGSALGQAYASAMYIDNAFGGRHPSYSATDHLNAKLLGGLIGGLLDTQPRSSYQFRYTIRNLDGDVFQRDQVSADSFRLPVGACISIDSFSVVNNDHCLSDVTAFRQKFLRFPNNDSPRVSGPRVEGKTAPGPKDRATLVRCKFGTSAPVSVSAQLCHDSEGRILE